MHWKQHGCWTLNGSKRVREARCTRGLLHGMPVALKDVSDTDDMPTTAGSLALRGFLPPDDAFIVRRLREAGAIILGKTNMDELAVGFAGRSSVGGQTRNPYSTDRVPGGSSGGTAAAIAANFAVLGTGSDNLGSLPMQKEEASGISCSIHVFPARALAENNLVSQVAEMVLAGFHRTDTQIVQERI